MFICVFSNLLLWTFSKYRQGERIVQCTRMYPPPKFTISFSLICFSIKQSIYPSFYPSINLFYSWIHFNMSCGHQYSPPKHFSLHAINLSSVFVCQLVGFKQTYFIFALYLEALYWHYAFSRLSYLLFAISSLSPVVLISFFPYSLLTPVSFLFFRNSRMFLNIQVECYIGHG